jgi:hypothetical protein
MFLRLSIVNRPTRLKLNNNVQSSRKKEIEAEEKFESTLSEEQLQALEEENNSLVEGFERTLDEIKYSPPPAPCAPKKTLLNGQGHRKGAPGDISSAK